MAPIKDGPLKPLRAAGVFQHIAVFLFLTHFYEGQCVDIQTTQTVVAMVGDDIMLPCQLHPPVDAVSMTMEWGRPDLNPRFVFVWHDSKELLAEQNTAYKGRTSLSINNLKRGDISLKLSPVKVSDSGTYRCYIPKLRKEYFVELLVGAASSPATSLAGIDKSSSGVMLVCESAGWYPEPEVLWLDGEGNLLSAGPTETVRGPDDLYTVSSRVTVEKRHSNSFTCRVQQKDTNQTREAQIYIPEDLFVAPCGCAASTAMSVIFGLMFVVTVFLSVWKWRKNKIEMRRQLKNKDDEREEQKRTTELQSLLKTKRSREHLMAENKKMEEELKKKETDMTQIIDVMKGLMQEMVNQNETISDQKKKAEKLLEENKQKVQSVEKEITEKGGDATVKKAKGYRELREILTKTNWALEDRKDEFEKLHVNTEILLKKTHDEVNKISGDKLKENNKKQDTETDTGTPQTEKNQNEGLTNDQRTHEKGT